MIFTDINKINDLLPYVSLRLGKALAYLRDTDFENLPDGEIEIEGRNIYATLNTYKTEPRCLKKPEAHKKYIDVQFLIKGTEIIGVSPLQDDSKVLENYEIDRDLLFYENDVTEKSYILKEKELMVIFPWELHIPGCDVEGYSNTVRKLVIKVKIGG